MSTGERCGTGTIVLYCIVLYCIVLYCIVLYCIVLYCIVLNYYTGTPISPVHYFPGSPVKVKHRIQDMKHKQTNKQTNKTITGLDN